MERRESLRCRRLGALDRTLSPSRTVACRTDWQAPRWPSAAGGDVARVVAIDTMADERGLDPCRQGRGGSARFALAPRRTFHVGCGGAFESRGNGLPPCGFLATAVELPRFLPPAMFGGFHGGLRSRRGCGAR